MKGNQGCTSRHRGSGHRQSQTLQRTPLPQDSTVQEEQEDHEGDVDEREIWQVTDVTEEEFETTEGETVDLYDKLMAMSGWTVRDHDLT